MARTRTPRATVRAAGAAPPPAESTPAARGAATTSTRSPGRTNAASALSSRRTGRATVPGGEPAKSPGPKTRVGVRASPAATGPPACRLRPRGIGHRTGRHGLRAHLHDPHICRADDVAGREVGAEDDQRARLRPSAQRRQADQDAQEGKGEGECSPVSADEPVDCGHGWTVARRVARQLDLSTGCRRGCGSRPRAGAATAGAPDAADFVPPASLPAAPPDPPPDPLDPAVLDPLPPSARRPTRRPTPSCHQHLRIPTPHPC